MSAVRVSLAAIRSGGRYFLQRRDPAASRFPGLWEFPGGKVEPAETPMAALLRELREELGWVPSRVEPLPVLPHAYPGFQVELHLFICEGPEGCHTALGWGWFHLPEIARLPIPEANLRLLRLLEPLELSH